MSTEKPKEPKPKQPSSDEAKRILRRMQGEDGYDIFADRQPSNDERTRLQRAYEDSRP